MSKFSQFQELFLHLTCRSTSCGYNITAILQHRNHSWKFHLTHSILRLDRKYAVHSDFLAILICVSVHMSPTFLVDKNFTSDQSSIFLFYICSLNRLVLKVLFSSAIKNLGVNSLMSIASDFSLCPLTLLDQRARSHHLFCILHAIFTTFYSPNLFSETRRSSFLLPPFPSFSLMVANAVSDSDTLTGRFG